FLGNGLLLRDGGNQVLATGERGDPHSFPKRSMGKNAPTPIL
ncbi:MAG: hypothetical protein HW403_192, partial [Dehalococcoidia bacterium]|nr:hypothetical protein [Dehalococcoidia bacterium]